MVGSLSGGAVPVKRGCWERVTRVWVLFFPGVLSLFPLLPYFCAGVKQAGMSNIFPDELVRIHVVVAQSFT